MSDSVKLELKLAEILGEISEQTDIRETLNVIRNACIALQVKRMSYHLTPKLHSQTDQSVQLISMGFPQDWIALYENPEFRKHDPIPDVIMQYGEPMLWQDALAVRKLTEQERNFIEQLEAFDLWDGIGIPLFGKNLRNAYSAVQFEEAEMLFDKQRIATVAGLAMAGHLKICNIIERRKKHALQLSDREAQVIRRIANGFSNKAIAKDLDISDSTADTYVRRVFAKLDVNERIGATIKALELGILNL